MILNFYFIISSVHSKVVAISIENSPCIFRTLNLLNNLSEIREEFENHNINDMLLFSKKVNGEFYEIKREQENNFLLKEIIKVNVKHGGKRRSSVM